MKTKKTKPHGADRFLELVKAFPLRPIRSEEEHAEAMEVYRRLVLRQSPLTAAEQDYMETLLMLVSDYEKKKHGPATKQNPLSVLKHLMAERQMTVNDLGKVIGSQPMASMILNGKRGMSKANIHRLAKHFGVNAGLFV